MKYANDNIDPLKRAKVRVGQVQVNKSVPCRMHVDGFNAGVEMIGTLGDYSARNQQGPSTNKHKK